MIRALTIRDLEKASGLPRTTIHYYLREGLLPRPHKSAASRSLYTEDHVRILQEITELRRSGLSVAEIANEVAYRIDEANEGMVDLAAQEYKRVHDRILAAATREFAAKGFQNTYVTTIIRKLGITAPTFYAHFPSKRHLLTECVNALLKWSLEYGDEKTAGIEDPIERRLWEVSIQSLVFELGRASFAVVREEGPQTNSELRKSIDEGIAGAVARILNDLQAQSSDDEERSISPELIALSLYGGYEQTYLYASTHNVYTRRDLLRTHLWLFLVTQAALRGEIDVDSRLAPYEELIEKAADEVPPLPPSLQLE